MCNTWGQEQPFNTSMRIASPYMYIVYTTRKPTLCLQCYSVPLRFHYYNYYSYNLHSLILETLIEWLLCASHLSSDLKSAGKVPNVKK